MAREGDNHWVCGACGNEKGEPEEKKDDRRDGSESNPHLTCPECGTKLKSGFRDSQGRNPTSRKFGSGSPGKKQVCPDCGFNK